MQGRRNAGPSFASPLAGGAVLIAALLAGVFPLTGTPGPEAAQLLALIGGPALLLAGAARGAARLERGFSGDLVRQGVLLSVAFAGFVTLIALAGFRHESCAPGRGYLPFFALSLPVLLLNSAIGLWLGRLAGRTRIAVGVSAALVAGYLLWLVLDWLVDPSFRVLTHLLVLVEGDMLKGREISAAAWAYRTATLCFAVALCFVGVWKFPRSRRSGLSAGPGAQPTWLLAGALLVGLGVVIHLLSSAELAPSRRALERTYAVELRRGPLVVRANPADLTIREAEAILAEGALWLDRLAVRMGVTPTEDITVWLHKDSATLGHWTGADHVHFALPMHGELHIAGAEVPHRSLGHELVHVLGGELSDTLLGVPARLGVLVNSGLVEGLAMAMTPELETKQGLTLREKAAAMRRAGLAPPADELFAEYTSLFSFWSQNPGRAYVTAGALMEALAATKGSEGLAAVYGEGRLEAAFATDEELQEFLAHHQQDLDAMTLPDDAVPQVARTYARPSILDETCDRELMERADDIRDAARVRDWGRAEALVSDVEGEVRGATWASLAQHASLLDDHERSARYLVLAANSADTDDVLEVGARRSAAGDALWRIGKRREALVQWERIDLEKQPPYPQRLVTAKLLLGNAIRGAGGELPLAEAALALVLQPDDTDDAARLAILAEALVRHGAATPPEVRNLSRYLLARQYLQRGALDEGLDLTLRLIETRGLDLLFTEEVLRGLAMGHARRGDHAVAEVGFERIAKDTYRPAVRILMRDRAERSARIARARGDDAHRGDAYLLGIGRAGGL